MRKRTANISAPRISYYKPFEHVNKKTRMRQPPGCTRLITRGINPPSALGRLEIPLIRTKWLPSHRQAECKFSDQSEVRKVSRVPIFVSLSSGATRCQNSCRKGYPCGSMTSLSCRTYHTIDLLLKFRPNYQLHPKRPLLPLLLLDDVRRPGELKPITSAAATFVASQTPTARVALSRP